ncbi:MAG: hypothetical protein HC851_24385 [Acaryochloris sp. RU_4_1]|nr:hypothetical protein [Acaryochloris sp. RU_4_1]
MAILADQTQRIAMIQQNSVELCYTKAALSQAKSIATQPPIDRTRPEVQGITIDIKGV